MQNVYSKKANEYNAKHAQYKRQFHKHPSTFQEDQRIMCILHNTLPSTNMDNRNASKANKANEKPYNLQKEKEETYTAVFEEKQHEDLKA